MFKVLDTICQPTRATKYSAMVDLYAREDVVIGAGETKIVPLGVKIDIKNLMQHFQKADERITWYEAYLNDFLKRHYLVLHIRSSLAVKGLIIPNGEGVIDIDYPDEIGLIVHNPIIDITFGICNGTIYTIKKGDKVAQCTLMEHKGYLMGIESDAERSGGFGSTGV